MGIDKVAAGRLPATPPAAGVRPQAGHAAEAAQAGPEARVPEDVRASVGGGQASALSAGAEGPIGGEGAASGAAALRGPAATGVLLSNGLPIGGHGLLRLAGGPGKAVEGPALSALRIRISAGDRSLVVRPADLGLTRIAIGG